MTANLINETKLFLNTWGAYNDGSIGYGWMSPAECIEFIGNDPERDGGEFFIADIDNYTGLEFHNLEYCNVTELCEMIQQLEEMEEDEKNEIVALMEVYSYSLEEALENYDNHIFYSDIDSYFDCCDELLDFSGCNEILERYFNYDAYHRDCAFDVTEASNGIVVSNY